MSCPQTVDNPRQLGRRWQSFAVVTVGATRNSSIMAYHTRDIQRQDVATDTRQDGMMQPRNASTSTGYSTTAEM